MKHKKDFPIFESQKGLVYLDSASTSQKPKQVIKSIVDSYETTNANIHRGIYDLSQKATKKYEDSKKIIAKFIKASEKEIIFTRSTTESINFLAYTLPSILSKEKDEIVLTEMEHHSNIVPWQQLAKRNNMRLKFIRVKDDFTLDLEDAKRKINEKTAIVSLMHVSNTFGTINPVKWIFNLAKKHNSITVLDAAQSVAHMKIDVRDLNCDFLTFSGHKIYAPMGIGVLYGRRDLLERLSPFNFGGDMIKSVTLEKSEWNTIPERFEAGTQNIEGAIALGEAIRYLEKIGITKIGKWEKDLIDYAAKELIKVKGIKIYLPRNHTGILSFNVEGLHSHDVASMLDDYNICIRAGHHCNMPLMKRFGITGTARASFALYNTKEDADKLILAINEVTRKLNNSSKRDQIKEIVRKVK
ncbi:cysteine desulfurase [Candidatus Pacearchaeota archaeon]|nr:cysteine desulfurase [Candidatus Pacearchaeota archaeon]